MGPGKLSRYSDSLRAGRSVDRIPVGGEIFRTRPDRPWGPPSLLYNEYRVFPGGKTAGAWSWPSTHHLAPRLKEEYSYTSDLPPWAFVACYMVTFTFTFTCKESTVFLASTLMKFILLSKFMSRTRNEECTERNSFASVRNVRLQWANFHENQ